MTSHTGDVMGSAALIRKASVKRKAQRGAQDLATITEDDSLSLPQMMDKMLQVTTALASQVSALDGHGKVSLRDSMRDLARRTMAAHKSHMAGDALIWGVLSGFTALDDVTFGWQRQELVIVTGRPGTGKSAFLNCLALNALRNNETVLSIPLEMTPLSMTLRMAAIESGISSKRIKMGQLTKTEVDYLMECMDRIAEHEAAERFFYLTFDGIPTMAQVVGKVNQHMAIHGADLILFDQLSTDAIAPAHPAIKPKDMVSQAVTVLRGLAKAHNVPVVSAAQLNRQGVDRPRLEHLAESDSMGKVPDIVIALYTEESQEGLAVQETELIFLKNREGEKTTVKLNQIPSLTKFVNQEA
jgi:replicative DNA helicase